MYLNKRTRRMCLKLNASWLILAILLPLTSGDQFEGDACTMKSIPGVCKLASQCPELEMAVRTGKFSTRDIVNCGYTTREEIICCPGDRRGTIDNRQTFTTTTTTATTSTDFWAHLLTTTTPSTASETTTPKPDFWLHLLNTTTSTTTPLPLEVNGKKLDTDTGFIDLSELLQQNGRRQRNNEAGVDSKQPVAENQSELSRPIPDSVNDRTFGWQAPQLGIPNQPSSWNMQRPRQWNTGAAHNFRTNEGMPFVDNWRNTRDGGVMLGTFPNQQSFGPPNQSNFAWPNQQETTLPRPAVAWTPPNQFNQFPNPSFEEAKWNNPNSNTWPPNGGVNNFERQPQNEWRNGNDISSTNNFVENFGPINNGIQNQNMFEKPLPERWSNPSAPSNVLPNRPIWPGNDVQQQKRPSNFHNKVENPTTMVNADLINSELEIIKAEANEMDPEYANHKLNFIESSEEVTTTTRAPVSDIYAPFQFRPQHKDDYVDNTVNTNINSPQGSRDFRFPGPVENRPAWNFNQSKKNGNNDDDPVITNSNNLNPVTSRTNDRPAVIACREIDDNLYNDITPHILGGTKVELEEFPHMAAIGYRSIGNDQGFYDYRCGGTLIAKRFVLTAAHCVNSRDSQPEVVLLGLVDINNATEREKADEVRIRQVHIHNDYSNSRVYHDIAILELERDVVYSPTIYPTCVYTQLDDPPPKFPIYVSGWGQINAQSREKSNILLKAKLEVVSVSQCNNSYVEMGLNRRINIGVTNMQMCAHYPGFKQDACQGDSGGPLILVADESIRKYRIIGIISAGFSCGSATPGLYTRVASYLDFIESIVWPNLV